MIFTFYNERGGRLDEEKEKKERRGFYLFLNPESD